MTRIARCIEVLLPVTTVVLLILQVVYSNQLTSHGKKVGEYESEMRIALEEKAALEIEVASASALLTIRAKAEALGFIEPTVKQFLTLTPKVPVAVRP